MQKKITIFLIILLLATAGIFYYKQKKNQINATPTLANHASSTESIVAPEKKDRIEKVKITEGATYGELMTKAGVDNATAMAIYDSAIKTYDLAKVRVDRFIELTYDKDSDEFKELYYKIDSEEQLHVWHTTKQGTATSSLEKLAWITKKEAIPYEVKIVTSKGTVQSSMYVAAMENNIDERAIMALADVFQWTIDFAMDPRVGDMFAFVWEQRFLNGEYVMPGRILAGKYVNSGKEFGIYYFEENANNKAYFGKDGNSVQRMFLRAPVEFRYISSGFTTGRRYVEAFNVSTGHRAIDYAAGAGTPIRSVGNGTVVSAGWGGPYGNKTVIRHNGTYTTNYCHQSKMVVKSGEKVKQGEIIGYVGSTGFSTGPHLHYEMVKNGVKINPYDEVLPPGEVMKAESKERFFGEVKKYEELMK